MAHTAAPKQADVHPDLGGQIVAALQRAHRVDRENQALQGGGDADGHRHQRQPAVLTTPSPIHRVHHRHQKAEAQIGDERNQ